MWGLEDSVVELVLSCYANLGIQPSPLDVASGALPMSQVAGPDSGHFCPFLNYAHRRHLIAGASLAVSHKSFVLSIIQPALLFSLSLDPEVWVSQA